VGPEELALIEASGWKRFPPRLPEQPIFYPVCNEEYAREIAERWNVQASGSGFVTRFEVRTAVAARYPVQTVGRSYHQELWVPAEELDAFNDAIVGRIEVVGHFEAALLPQVARARAAGPIAAGSFRVVVFEADGRVHVRDFDELEAARRYADDAASEAEVGVVTSSVLDDQLRVVHRGEHY
jgi:hypothetical protein